MCPHNTLGNELQASMAPCPVPHPVTTKSTAFVVNKIDANKPFFTYVN